MDLTLHQLLLLCSPVEWQLCPWGQLRHLKTNWGAPVSKLEWHWNSNMQSYILDTNLGAIFPQTLKGTFLNIWKHSIYSRGRYLSTYHLPSSLHSTWYFYSNTKAPHKRAMCIRPIPLPLWIGHWLKECHSQLLPTCGLQFSLTNMQHFRGNRTFWK